MYYEIKDQKRTITFDTNVMCAIAGITLDFLILDMPDTYFVGTLKVGE